MLIFPWLGGSERYGPLDPSTKDKGLPSQTHFHAVSRNTRIEVRRKFANVVTSADGLVVELRAYADRDQALEVMGLRE